MGGAALATFIFYLTAAPIYCFAIFSSSKTSWRDVAKIYLAPLALSACAVGIAMLVCVSLPLTPLSRLCLAPPLALALYLPAIARAAPETSLQIWRRVTALWGRGGVRHALS